PNDEVRRKSEAQMTKHQHISFDLCVSSLFRHFSLVLQILEKIRFSSLASIQSFRASALSSGTARTIIRRKCFVSRASFRHVPMFLRNSFFDTASSASK